MRWRDGFELGNGLDGLGAGSVFQSDTLTDATPPPPRGTDT